MIGREGRMREDEFWPVRFSSTEPPPIEPEHIEFYTEWIGGLPVKRYRLRRKPPQTASTLDNPSDIR